MAIDEPRRYRDSCRQWSTLLTAIWYDKISSDGMAWGSLEDVLATGQKWGVPPVTLKAYVDAGHRHWIGVFRETGAPTQVRGDLSWQDVLALGGDPGQAISHLEPYLDNGIRKWVAIVEQRRNNVGLTWWSNMELYRDEVQRLAEKEGFSVTDFAICRGWE